jgi:hypothetical protein
MSNYVYAEAYDENVIKTISASSLANAEERIIEKLRDEYEIDREFTNYHEFKNYMWEEFEVLVSTPQDIEAL